MTEVKISNKWERILNAVQHASSKSKMRVRHGSALIRKGKVIHTGYNHNDRSQWHGTTVPAIHAEMQAINGLRHKKFEVMHRGL
jgi:deoxycytidylate deaminase